MGGISSAAAFLPFASWQSENTISAIVHSQTRRNAVAACITPYALQTSACVPKVEQEVNTLGRGWH